MMGIWLPYNSVQKNLAVLNDSHLADVLFQGLDTLRDVGLRWKQKQRHGLDPHAGESRHSRMWLDCPAALLFYVVSAEEEFRRRGLGEERRVYKAFTWYYYLDIPLAPVPPWWYGHQMFHRSHRSHLIQVDPGWYARRLPLDTPLDMKLFWPMAELNEWEMTGAGRDRGSVVGRGRNSEAHKEHVRNNFRRKKQRS